MGLQKSFLTGPPWRNAMLGWGGVNESGLSAASRFGQRQYIRPLCGVHHWVTTALGLPVAMILSFPSDTYP